MVVISKGYDVSKKIGILFVNFVKNVSKVVTFRRNLKMSFSGALYSTLGGSVGFATTLGAVFQQELLLWKELPTLWDMDYPHGAALDASDK